MSKEAKSKEPEVHEEEVRSQRSEVRCQKTEDKGQSKEKYYRMKFHAKSNPNDPDDVVLSVNGEINVIERQKEVVLPERFKVCAENARSPQFRQMPNQTRKIVGEVITFPFDLLGEGTEEQYLNMRREGTKATREANAKDGTAAQ